MRYRLSSTKELWWYGAFSNRCSLFPTASVIAEFKNEPKGSTTSKGTIHLPIDKRCRLHLLGNS
jgi:hypothetical protein